ncbi:D-alanyl-D-alanine carboxypeptidase (penicillin-binding protein 5/6) [Alkalithermobacter thermoalcaliphilus JW-YL-7 = DSM 7308]|uniref:serine-type D-Ala-D-Ala carboxypeptidase n=1 Tax=Alkalithermobacter thermoalcaliphilus JW-YL-7 = DSM 7308 TaxID=1121328 RepID=A0A150FQP9_CLOPD|nr:Serine-type D-Ala-D-Ala carboxypeptidase [[Clostridium] paradoxum JW-YL-7 = DSM 7308]SHK76499.1 D-alanyl-D-alanine carboxypeptidase (penicillin-binding protein 5/6) [[Clostridium] paradoxum JW-YL-7 = DSM 7308]
MKKTLSIFLICLLVFINIPIASANEAINITATSAILIDGKSGQIIYEKNAHEKLPPASVTKIMTLLLIMEALDEGRIKLDDKVTISEKAANMGGSQLYLEPGEVKDVETLIKGIAVASGNDASVAMAEFIYGSEEVFVNKMNERAKELGMTNTNFVNTNGLPVENHYTTAYDIALMSKELLKHESIHKYLTIWMEEIIVGKNQKKFGLVNTNKLIRFYKGANGIKTGFTAEAKYCLSASAQRDNLLLIAVVLGSPTSKERFSDASTLLNYGFANYESIKVYDKGEIVEKIQMDKSDDVNIEAVCKDPIYLLNKKGDKQEIEKRINVDKNIKLPISKGQKLGQVEIYKGDKLIAKSDLVSNKDHKKAGYFKILTRVVKNLI